MPEEHLRDLLGGTTPAATPALYRLQQAAKQVAHWGGQIVAHSSLGSGIHFEIRLPGTNLDDARLGQSPSATTS